MSRVRVRVSCVRVRVRVRVRARVRVRVRVQVRVLVRVWVRVSDRGHLNRRRQIEFIVIELRPKEVRNNRRRAKRAEFFSPLKFRFGGRVIQFGFQLFLVLG